MKNLKEMLNKQTAVIAIIVVLLVSLGILGYLYRVEKLKSANPGQLVQENTQKIVEKVGKLIILPANEDPTVATIINIEKLKSDNPEFYLNATNGDKLLLYQKKAIIYSEENNIIVNVASIIKQPAKEAVKQGVK